LLSVRLCVPSEFLKARSCPVYVSSGRTAEETPPPAVWRVVFCVVPVASKQSRLLILPRTSGNTRIILSSTPTCPKWSCRFRFLAKKCCACLICLIHPAFSRHHLNLLDLIRVTFLVLFVYFSFMNGSCERSRVTRDCVHMDLF
jgi:hypothetical protein